MDELKYPIPEPAMRKGGAYVLVGDELIPEEDAEYLAMRQAEYQHTAAQVATDEDE